MRISKQKQFQQTRKKVTAYYDCCDEESGVPKETAYTYANTFQEFIGECNHICIWDNVDIINKHNGKYYLILENCEYNSNDLNELEVLLWDWMSSV